MAKVPDADMTYEVAARFRERCLARVDSLLWPRDQVWTPDNIGTLQRAFEERDKERSAGDLQRAVGPPSK